MNKKIKIFLIVLILSIIISIVFTYHRSFISKNYNIDISEMEDINLE